MRSAPSEPWRWGCADHHLLIPEKPSSSQVKTFAFIFFFSSFFFFFFFLFFQAPANTGAHTGASPSALPAQFPGRGSAALRHACLVLSPLQRCLGALCPSHPGGAVAAAGGCPAVLEEVQAAGSMLQSADTSQLLKEVSAARVGR